MIEHAHRHHLGQTARNAHPRRKDGCLGNAYGRSREVPLNQIYRAAWRGEGMSEV